MKTNDIFEKVKEKAFFTFSLNNISIDGSFFSRFDEEFKESESFKIFVGKVIKEFAYVTEITSDYTIQPIAEMYFKFCMAKFDELSLNEKVDLAAEHFFNNLSYYRGSKLHGIIDAVKKELLMSDLDTLFNGDYYADLIFAIGNHFQQPVTLKEIAPKLKKDITRLIDAKKDYYILREPHCFKYMKCVDAIFKVSQLKTEMKAIAIKHGIKENKETL